MTERNHHVIERQILELDVASLARAPAVQEAAAARLRAHALTELEALFDRLAGPGRVVRLERVEIDLGDLLGPHWQDEFESRLVTRLAHTLEQAAAAPVPAAATPASDPGTAVEQWLFFLQHGRLPWWGETPPANWPQPLLQALEPHHWRALAAVLSQNDCAQRRLIHAVSDVMLAALLNWHAGLNEVLSVLALWRPAHLAQVQHVAWRTQFWLAVLEPVISGNVAVPGVTIMQKLLRLRTAFATTTPQRTPPNPAHSVPDLPAPWDDWLAEAQRDTGANPPATPIKSPHAPTAPNAAAAPGGSTTAAAEAPRHPGQGRNESRDTVLSTGAAGTGATPAHDGTHRAPVIPFPARNEAPPAHGRTPQACDDAAIYLNGAGCIILHPFIAELYRSNALLDGRVFRDATARDRAVHLLAYLTFGDEATAEYELLLPKLLCGMAWEEPLAPGELTEEERSTCDELLRAVLGHWRALKSSSTQWMREQFFLRAAKLEPLDLNWRLTVERCAQDVLLDRLPWGLGVIGLPWMQKRIYVHWMQ